MVGRGVSFLSDRGVLISYVVHIVFFKNINPSFFRGECARATITRGLF